MPPTQSPGPQQPPAEPQLPPPDPQPALAAGSAVPAPPYAAPQGAAQPYPTSVYPDQSRLQPTAQPGAAAAYQPSGYPASAPAPAYPAAKPAPVSAGSPYDFFLEAQPKKQRAARIGGMSGFTKFILAAVGVFAILGILAVVLNAGKSHQPTPVTGVAALAAQQQEIIRVSSLGQTQVISPSLQNFIATAAGSLTSEQQALVSYASKQGVKISAAQLASAKNGGTDQALSAAQAANTYDDTFKSTMQSLLNNYQTKLQQTHDATASQSERDLLGQDLTAAQLLAQMLNQ